MTRLILSGLMVLILALSGTGQTTYWQEKFISPDGWTLQDNWQLGGGSLLFDWNPTIYNFDQSAISPVILLDEQVTELVVNQYLQVYNPSEEESAQLIIVAGDEEFVIWDYTLSSGNWGNYLGEDLSFSLESFAGQSIRIKLRTFGITTFNWSAWQIFEINIVAEYENDLSLSNIMGPKNLDLLQTGDWVVEVTNHGALPINEYTVNLIDSKSGLVLDELPVTNVIEPGDSKIFGFSWVPDVAYNTVIYGQVAAGDDQFLKNNLSEGKFLRIEPEIEYSILVWDNDNGIQSIQCPEKGDMVRPLTGLTRAMDDAGLEYEVYTYLPDNLNSFDVVLATMGCYCLS